MREVYKKTWLYQVFWFCDFGHLFPKILILEEKYILLIKFIED